MNYYNTIQTFFKVEAGVNALEFGPNREFNGTRCGTIYRSLLQKQLIDSYRVEIKQKGAEHKPINTLKLTNQSLLTWDDYWVDRDRGIMVDPLIHNLNLQRNKLIYVNINMPRTELNTLNLEGNKDLAHLYIHYAPNLRELVIDGCKSLQYISLGENKMIKRLSARNCNLSPVPMQYLLRDFRPTLTSNSNERGAGMFRKNYETELDLRGNMIDWGNRKIASKIRLLLCNNWVVKWDENPPADIIPPSLYAFFVESKVERPLQIINPRG